MKYLMLEGGDLIIDIINIDGSIFRGNPHTKSIVKPLGDTYSEIEIEISYENFYKMKWDSNPKMNLVVLNTNGFGFYFYGSQIYSYTVETSLRDTVQLTIISDYHEAVFDNELKSLAISIERDEKLNKLGL